MLLSEDDYRKITIGYHTLSLFSNNWLIVHDVVLCYFLMSVYCPCKMEAVIMSSTVNRTIEDIRSWKQRISRLDLIQETDEVQI